MVLIDTINTKLLRKITLVKFFKFPVYVPKEDEEKFPWLGC